MFAQVQSDGKSLMDHLLSVKAQGINPLELENLVELPESLREQWFWFLALNSTRQCGFGFSPISYSEIYSFFKLIKIEPDQSDIDVIRLFDSVAIDANNKKQQKEQKNKKK